MKKQIAIVLLTAVCGVAQALSINYDFSEPVGEAAIRNIRFVRRTGGLFSYRGAGKSG